jgi:hypothetical protein
MRVPRPHRHNVGFHWGFVSPALQHWILVIDTLNFSFWSTSGVPFTVKYKGQAYTGYWALCAAVNRAIDEGSAIPAARAVHVLNDWQQNTVKGVLYNRHGIVYSIAC